MRARGWSVVTGVVLAAAGVMAWTGTTPWRANLDRQPHVQADLSAMDTAVAAALNAAQPRAAIAVAGLVRSRSCTLGISHHAGGIFTRAADLFSAPGAEAGLVASIAQHLPAAWSPHLVHSMLEANPTNGVRLQISRIGDGWLSVRASTGCVLGDDTIFDDKPAPVTTTPIVEDILTSMHTIAARTFQTAISCGSNGIRTTVTFTQPTDSAGLPQRLRHLVPPTAQIFTSQANRLAYRDNSDSLIAAATDDGSAATIRTTTRC